MSQFFFSISLILFLTVIGNALCLPPIFPKEIGQEKFYGALPMNLHKVFISSFLNNCSNVKKEIGIEGRSPDTSHLKLDLWHLSGKESFKLDETPDKLINSNLYNETLPITIFVHGFLSSSEGTASMKVVHELLVKGQSNVLALDSEDLVKISYLISSSNIYYIGRSLGKYLATFPTEKFGNIHIIGHSLGAHIASFAAKTFTELTTNKIARISGLDPAGPCFLDENPSKRLNSGDAYFVDVIHTNNGVYGYTQPIGDVDFYPNNGENQPGCRNSYCSHARSWELFAESVNSPRAFPALECINWANFVKGKCKGHQLAYMGYEADEGIEGVYYLRTEESAPYGKGDDGIEETDAHDPLAYLLNITHLIF